MKLQSLKERATSNRSGRHVSGRCLCGAVELEIDFPAFWAWHDHSAASRRAHGAAYATYIGCWRKHARVVKGQSSIARFEDAKTESTRSFCSRCGAPLLYERKRWPHMVNIPRALFSGRTGREPRYHVAIEELQDWTYTGNRLVTLKGYPGIVWERPKSRRRPRELIMLSSATGASRPHMRISSGERIRVPKIDPNTVVSSSRGNADRVR
jgi:hypothetical protein